MCPHKPCCSSIWILRFPLWKAEQSSWQVTPVSSLPGAEGSTRCPREVAGEQVGTRDELAACACVPGKGQLRPWGHTLYKGYTSKGPSQQNCFPTACGLALQGRLPKDGQVQAQGLPPGEPAPSFLSGLQLFLSEATFDLFLKWSYLWPLIQSYLWIKTKSGSRMGSQDVLWRLWLLALYSFQFCRNENALVTRAGQLLEPTVVL